MSTTATRQNASGAFRIWIALTVAGWLTVIGLALPSAMSSDSTQSPTLQIDSTPVKAYPG